ncbi:hypothetical protein SAMN06265360_10726 [Haloechinothrix alba]|uniref:Uncharacterized protein n=1 Tax=Haloechinothrix alba TaxID=664784 RepID=A0A238WR21_9PSEU|nr:hypothetical protein [Haloechinothrix alba]SNR48099.1 hypothetical protein SAMN06265360_10726 [Haloechinothrix alba]
MSTGRSRRNAENPRTVAELVARESRGDASPDRVRPDAHEGEQASVVPVAELLRREGSSGTRAGSTAPATSTGTSFPASAQSLGKVATQATAARIPDSTEAGEGHKSHFRGATVGSAAVLCGLTLAGLVALKPTTALSPETDDRATGSSDSTQPHILEPDGGDITTASVAMETTSSSNTGAHGVQGASERQGDERDTASSTSGGDTASGTTTRSAQPTSTTQSEDDADSGARSGTVDDSTGDGDSDGSTDSGSDDGTQDGDGDKDGNEDEDSSLLDPVEGVVGGVLDTTGALLGG